MVSDSTSTLTFFYIDPTIPGFLFKLAFIDSALIHRDRESTFFTLQAYK